MDQKLAFHRGYNAPTQISKYIRGFYSAGSAVISKIGTQYGPRSCFPYHYNPHGTPCPPPKAAIGAL